MQILFLTGSHDTEGGLGAAVLSGIFPFSVALLGHVAEGGDDRDLRAEAQLVDGALQLVGVQEQRALDFGVLSVHLDFHPLVRGEAELDVELSQLRRVEVDAEDLLPGRFRVLNKVNDFVKYRSLGGCLTGSGGGGVCPLGGEGDDLDLPTLKIDKDLLNL